MITIVEIIKREFEKEFGKSIDDHHHHHHPSSTIESFDLNSSNESFNSKKIFQYNQFGALEEMIKSSDETDEAKASLEARHQLIVQEFLNEERKRYVIHFFFFSHIDLTTIYIYTVNGDKLTLDCPIYIRKQSTQPNPIQTKQKDLVKLIHPI